MCVSRWSLSHQGLGGLLYGSGEDASLTIVDPSCNNQSLQRWANALWLHAFASRVEAIASRLEAIASRVEAIASRVEAIASRVEALAIRLQT